MAWSQLLCPGPCLRSPPHPQKPTAWRSPQTSVRLLAASLRKEGPGSRPLLETLTFLALNRSSPPPHFPGVHLPLIPGRILLSLAPAPAGLMQKPSSLRRRTSLQRSRAGSRLPGGLSCPGGLVWHPGAAVRKEAGLRPLQTPILYLYDRSGTLDCRRAWHRPGEL